MNKWIHCPHFDVCSGCVLNENVDNPPVLQEAQTFFTSKGLTQFTLRSGSPIHWRCRAKLAIRGSAFHPLIGLYQEGTHDVVNIPLCRVHHPAINRAVETLRQWIVEEALSPYEETTRCGLLRYVQLVVERSSGNVQVALVINASQLSDELQQALHRLWLAGRWHSLWVNCNVRGDNIIFGSDWHLIDGEPLLWEKMGDIEVCFHPSSFGQANLEMFDEMLDDIRRIVPEQKRVAEYYAGSGIIGLNVAAKSSSVRCCEVNPGSEVGFNAARDKLDSALAAKVSFESGPVAKKLHLVDDADVVIVDPPRKGLDPLLLKALNHVTHSQQLIYVSCGWKSFCRDCEDLLNGGWTLQHAEGYLFFPGSNHIEVLASFG